MTIKELAEISSISEKSVKKQWNKIPGAYEENGTVTFPSGSRYPFDLHRYKLNNQEKRRVALLDAISRQRYVDHKSLKTSEESFNSLIEELVAAGLIRENGTSNQYGANAYDTTMEYDKIKSQGISKRTSEIASIITALGSLIGVIAN